MDPPYKVLADSGVEDKIILHVTQSKLYHLPEAECFYVDATFETCPRVLSDLYRPHHQVRPDLPYGVRSASQQAEYLQPHVYDGEEG